MHRSSIYLERWCAEDYDRERFGGAFGRYLHDQEVATFLSLLEGPPGWVLDVGAGTGKLSFPLLRRSWKVISVDASSEMLRVAAIKAKKAGEALTPVVCDAHRLCFRDDTFDCVVSSRVMMHLQDWQVGLSELCRVTRRLVVLDFPPVQSVSAFNPVLKRLGGFLSSATRPYRLVSLPKAKRELTSHQCRVVAVKKHFFLPVALHRLLNRPRLSLALERLCGALGLVYFFGAPVTLAAVKEKAT